MFYTHKKDLTAIPLDTLFQYVFEAGKRVEDSLVKDSRAAHDRKVARIIEAEYEGREDSYEGNVEEDYPFQGPDPSYVQDEKDKAKKAAFALWAEKHDLPGHFSWLMPQLTSLIAKLDPCGGNCKEYVQHFGKDDYHKGIWTLAKHPVRGDLVPKQYSAEGRNYSALVPLLLMPHKKFNNFNYNNWNNEGLANLVDSNLYSAMTLKFDHDMKPAEILQIREKALTYLSGKQIGQVRNAQTSHKVYSLSGELRKLPWLAQVMLFQIWCAHPVNRTDLMILDWKDWDNVPEPLITKEIGSKPTVATTWKTTVADDKMPWDI